MSRVCLFHPAKFAGKVIAVRVLEYFRDGVHGDQLRVDVLSQDEARGGLVVRQGGLVGQWIGWQNSGPVIGVLGQTGSGYTTPWMLHPIPECDRGLALSLLSTRHAVAWLDREFISVP